MLTEIVVGSTVILIITYILRGKGNKKCLPGPRGVPLLGSLPFLGSNPYKTMGEWSKIYGNIFSMYLGPLQLIVINSADMIREAGKRPEMSGRPNIGITALWAGAETTDQMHGIGFNEGEEWQEQRRFALRQLRDLGFGKRSMEDLIVPEIQEFISILKEKCGKPIEIEHMFEAAVINSLWTIVAGRRFESGDKRLQQLSRDTATFTDMASVGLGTFFPTVSKMFPDLLGWNNLVQAVDNIRNLAKTEVKSHKKTFNPDDPPRDLIDVYLKEIHNTTDNHSSFFEDKGMRSLCTILMDFFGAGIETTTTAMAWACLLLAVNPQIQRKMHIEIDAVIGRNRVPALSDRSKMPYMEAVMLEVLRFSSIIPLMLFHKVLEETEFQGYTLPKGALIALNGYYVMRDPKNFDNPEEFRPERFLDSNGSCKSNENVLTFGSGKRGCPGETLAKNQIFLFLSSIFQNFDIRMPDDNPNPSLKFKSPAMAIHPTPYTVIVTERK